MRTWWSGTDSAFHRVSLLSESLVYCESATRKLSNRGLTVQKRYKRQPTAAGTLVPWLSYCGGSIQSVRLIPKVPVSTRAVVDNSTPRLQRLRGQTASTSGFALPGKRRDPAISHFADGTDSRRGRSTDLPHSGWGPLCRLQRWHASASSTLSVPPCCRATMCSRWCRSSLFVLMQPTILTPPVNEFGKHLKRSKTHGRALARKWQRGPVH